MKYCVWMLLMEDSGFQLKLKHFSARTPVVWFCSATQLSSEILLFFGCMGCNWEITFVVKPSLFVRCIPCTLK